MNTKQFFSVLENIKGGEWEESDTQLLRWTNGDSHYCPITMVCEYETGVHYPVNSWEYAARRLKLPAHVAESLIDAADFKTNNPLRKRLEKVWERKSS